jgi:hypothetical protein
MDCRDPYVAGSFTSVKFMAEANCPMARDSLK